MWLEDSNGNGLRKTWVLSPEKEGMIDGDKDIDDRWWSGMWAIAFLKSAAAIKFLPKLDAKPTFRPNLSSYSNFATKRNLKQLIFKPNV